MANTLTPAQGDDGASDGPAEVLGDWVVDRDMCMACGAPAAEAPDLIHLGTTGTCYFKKQPETQLEVDQACRAAWASCCDQVQYRGDDPNVRRRMSEVVPAVHLRQRQKWDWILIILLMPVILVAMLFELFEFLRSVLGRRS